MSSWLTRSAYSVPGAEAIIEWSPDGRWLVVRRGEQLYRVSRERGEPALIGPGYTPRFSDDGQWLYYSVVTGRRG